MDDKTRAAIRVNALSLKVAHPDAWLPLLMICVDRTNQPAAEHGDVLVAAGLLTRGVDFYQVHDDIREAVLGLIEAGPEGPGA